MGWLFDTSAFFTRDHCGVGWTQAHMAISRVSDFMIFLSYTMIPVSLLVLFLRLRAEFRVGDRVNAVILANRWMIALFCAFIFSCGLTHLNDILVFEWAPYRFFTFMKVVTAACSVPTAILLPGVIRKVVMAVMDECGEPPTAETP